MRPNGLITRTLYCTLPIYLLPTSKNTESRYIHIFSFSLFNLIALRFPHFIFNLTSYFLSDGKSVQCSTDVTCTLLSLSLSLCYLLFTITLSLYVTCTSLSLSLFMLLALHYHSLSLCYLHFTITLSLYVTCTSLLLSLFMLLALLIAFR